MNLLAQGIVGSVAHGLGNNSSNVDRLGIYACHTIELFGFNRPKETLRWTCPDRLPHEAARFCKLALQCNPAALELLWLDEWEQGSELGQELFYLRDRFLSAKRVRDTYFDHAWQHVGKIRRPVAASVETAYRAKHAQHVMLLLEHGLELYTTGKLTVKAKDPVAVIAFGYEVSKGNFEAVDTLMDEAYHRWDKAVTVLPEHPDVAAVNSWLIEVRRNF